MGDIERLASAPPILIVSREPVHLVGGGSRVTSSNPHEKQEEAQEESSCCNPVLAAHGPQTQVLGLASVAKGSPLEGAWSQPKPLPFADPETLASAAVGGEQDAVEKRLGKRTTASRPSMETSNSSKNKRPTCQKLPEAEGNYEEPHRFDSPCATKTYSKEAMHPAERDSVQSIIW